MAADSGSDNPLDQLRLSLMQDVLPVGLAVFERARQGGAGRVAEVFTGGSADPIADLREEGEPVGRATSVSNWTPVSPGAWQSCDACECFSRRTHHSRR
jgi:hypothetical protein